MPETIIVDTSVLISLDKINLLQILCKMYKEVITFGYETGLTALIDDLKARKIAEDLGLKITGTIGVLLKAENLGLIKSAWEKTKELKEKGFHVSDELLADLYKFRHG